MDGRECSNCRKAHARRHGATGVNCPGHCRRRVCRWVSRLELRLPARLHRCLAMASSTGLATQAYGDLKRPFSSGRNLGRTRSSAVIWLHGSLRRCEVRPWLRPLGRRCSSATIRRRHWWFRRSPSPASAGGHESSTRGTRVVPIARRPVIRSCGAASSTSIPRLLIVAESEFLAELHRRCAAAGNTP